MTKHALLVGLIAAATAPFSLAFAADDRETTLSDVVQLTTGFDRAGEAYFSPDMSHIIFQATPKGEKHYAMYVAKLERKDERIVPLNLTEGEIDDLVEFLRSLTGAPVPEALTRNTAAPTPGTN